MKITQSKIRTLTAFIALMVMLPQTGIPSGCALFADWCAMTMPSAMSPDHSCCPEDGTLPIASMPSDAPTDTCCGCGFTQFSEQTSENRLHRPFTQVDAASDVVVAFLHSESSLVGHAVTYASPVPPPSSTPIYLLHRVLLN